MTKRRSSHAGRLKLKFWTNREWNTSMRHLISQSFSTNQVRHRCSSKSEALLFSLATDYGPFVRSYDENNGRTVFNYSPESCGYVSEVGQLRWRLFNVNLLVYSISHRRKQGRLSASRSDTSQCWGHDGSIRISFRKWKSDESSSSVRSSHSLHCRASARWSFDCSGEFEYELYLRYDLYTKRNTQWFYFRMQNLRANRRYRFTIVNFFKVTDTVYSFGISSKRSSPLAVESLQLWNDTVDVQCGRCREQRNRLATLGRRNRLL